MYTGQQSQRAPARHAKAQHDRAITTPIKLNATVCIRDATADPISLQPYAALSNVLLCYFSTHKLTDAQQHCPECPSTNTVHTAVLCLQFVLLSFVQRVFAD
jgi:hypothetical protein